MAGTARKFDRVKYGLAWNAVILFALVGLSIAAAVYSAGAVYHSRYTPAESRGVFFGIRADGWIADGSRMLFADLSSRGNQLILGFGAWHPPGKELARLRVEVCGKTASEFTVTPGDTERIYLTGICQPREVKFQVLNPFRASLRDRRLLGAQLSYAEVTSLYGVPLLSIGTLARIGAAIFVLGLLVFLAGGKGLVKLSCLVVPFLAWILIKVCGGASFGQLYFIWLILCGLALGIVVAVRIPGTAGSPSRSFVQDVRIRRAGLEWFPWMTVLVLLFFVAGGALRFYGLDFGLPSHYHPDEVQKHGVIMRMVAAEDLNPQYFRHPSLLLYLTYFMNSLWHWGGMSGEWSESLILAGRAVSALAGSFSILLTFLVGRRLLLPLAGVLGAGMLAFSPLHVTCSRYLKEDALLTFMVLGVVLLVLKAVQEERRWILFGAGLMAGCAAGSKYSGVLCAAMVLGAPWLKSRSIVPDWKWVGYALIALLLLPLGFVMVTPYSLFDTSTFIKDFMYEKWHMGKGHTSSIDPWSQLWMYHFSRSILPGMHPLAAFVGVAGLGVLLWRRRKEDLYLVALILLFYLPAEWVKAKPEPQPERYILPVLPFLALAGGELLCVLRSSRLRAVWLLTAFVVLGLSLQRCVRLASELRPDTRELMAAWMREHLPRGTKICMDWKWYTPAFPDGEFEVEYLPPNEIMSALDVQKLKSSGCPYLMMSSLHYGRYLKQPKMAMVQRERVRGVFRRFTPVKQISSRYGSYGFHNPDLTLLAVQ